MSTQGAQEFITQANQNPVIRKAARERYADIAGVGSDHGFDFTRDEFDQAMRERKAMGGGEEGDGGSSTCQCGTGSESGTTCQCGTGTENGTTCQCGGEQSEEETETPTSDTVCQCGGSDGGGTTCQCGS